MKTCYIFGALNTEITDFSPTEEDLIIAADAGYNIIKKLNIKPHFLVGDFDSLKTVPEDENIIKHPKEKDDTDTLLAVKIGLEKGYKIFKIYGILGGRLDQTVASLQTASYIAENGGIAMIFDGTSTVTAIKNSAVSFNENMSGTVSVFAFAGIAKGVTLSGLFYPLNNAEITPTFPLGVSNEFITGKKSKIEVKRGILTIIYNGKPNNLIFGGFYE